MLVGQIFAHLGLGFSRNRAVSARPGIPQMGQQVGDLRAGKLPREGRHGQHAGDRLGRPGTGAAKEDADAVCLTC